MSKSDLPATLEVPDSLRLLLEQRMRDEVLLSRVHQQRQAWAILEDRLKDRLSRNKQQLREPAFAFLTMEGKKTVNTPWGRLQKRTAKKPKLKAPTTKDGRAALVKVLRKDHPELVTTEVSYVYDWEQAKATYLKRMEETGEAPPECIDVIPAGDQLTVSILPKDTDLLMDGSSLLRSLLGGETDETTKMVPPPRPSEGETVRQPPDGAGAMPWEDDGSQVGRQDDEEVGDGPREGE